MLKRFASGLAIWALFVGSGLAFQESTLAPGVERRSPPVFAPAVPAAPADAARVPDAIQEVRALDRHARTGMICYAGAFGVPVKKAVPPALALNVGLQLKR